MRWAPLVMLCMLSACGSSAARVFAEQPTIAAANSSIANELLALPPPSQKLFVAVFAFQDQTGQHKPNDNFADYSFAVTQGGANILINALKEAGREKWFGVLERTRIGDLLQERQIIRANREEAIGPNGQRLPPLGPILNAGIVFEGGISGYDSNVLTGGLGANLLGIGGNINYRKDTVSVYLRAISVLSGEVLVSVTTDKTLYSSGVQGSANRYVSFNGLLQLEGGFTTNEPGQLAVRQAIEKAVYAVILDGADKGLWSFADKDAQQRLVANYVAQRDGHMPVPNSAPANGGSPSATTKAGVGG